LARLVRDFHPHRRFLAPSQSKENRMTGKRELKTNSNAVSVMAMQNAGPVANDPVSAVDHEEIARLAYSYWQARGCPNGSPEKDWYHAENDLRQPIVAAVASDNADGPGLHPILDARAVPDGPHLIPQGPSRGPSPQRSLIAD
jgi:hypothetical protein